MKIEKLNRAKEVLQATLKLFRKNGRWITGEMARDAQGYVCSPKSKKACFFCVVGGMRAVGGAGGANIASKAICLFGQVPAGTSAAFSLDASPYAATNVINFNDSYAHSWENVRALIKSTIKGINKELKTATV